MEPSVRGNGRRPRRRRSNGSPAQHSDNRNNQGRRNNNKRRRRGGRQGQSYHASHAAALQPVRDSSSVLGSREVAQKQRQQAPEGPPDAFGLFCAYYLGVTFDDGYQKPSLDNTARRFGISHEEIKELLVEHGLDSETMAESNFDLEGARLDVRLAPEGISRTEIARDHFEMYQSCQSCQED